MNLSVIGLGKLGTPMLAVFAVAGYKVIGADVNPAVVDLLNEGKSPVQEPGVQDLLTANKDRYWATTSTRFAVKESETTFVIVPTPSGPNGAFTLEHLRPVCEDIGAALAEKDGYHLVVITSTVMPGQTAELRDVLEQASGKQCGKDFGLCYSPEFIALGSVVHDLQQPDYVLIGENDSDAGDKLENIYRKMHHGGAGMMLRAWVNNVEVGTQFVRTNWVNAELAKLAQNAYITMKITFANQLGKVCGWTDGANVDEVLGAIGHDHRIGKAYLKAGTAYGGPCFPRDNDAFWECGSRAGWDLVLSRDVQDLNRTDLVHLVARLSVAASSGTVGILGISYKPGNTVIEESASIKLAIELLGRDYAVVVYDPLAMDETSKVLGGGVEYAASAADCVARADVVVLMHNDYQMIANQLFRDKIVIDPWRVLSHITFACKEYIPLGIGPQPEGVTA